MAVNKQIDYSKRSFIEIREELFNIWLKPSWLDILITPAKSH